MDTEPKTLGIPPVFGIGDAISRMRLGFRVARVGWNGRGMFLEIQHPDANSKMGRPYVYITGVDGLRVPWAPSQTDLLAEDWYVVPADGA